MTSNGDKLLAEALQLPEGDRADFAVRLIDSLDPTADEGADAAWDAEIQVRLEQLRTGQVKAVPRPDARRMILEDSDAASG